MRSDFAEKPKRGLILTVSAGVTNMILDALFIVGLKWGITGAAIATIIGQCDGDRAVVVTLSCVVALRKKYGY